MIGQDYTIRYGGRLYQVAREQLRSGLRGQRVRVEQRLDGTLVVLGPHGPLTITVCESAVRSTATVPAAKPAIEKKRDKAASRRWMYGFDLTTVPSLEEVVAGAYGELGEESEASW